MRQNVKAKELKDSFESVDVKSAVKVLSYHAAVLAAAFATARCSILKQLLPFGISAAAGAPSPFLISAGVGAVLGYAFPSGAFSGFRYVAAVLAAAAIRLVFSLFKKLRRSPLSYGAAGFMSALATGAVGIHNGKEFLLLLAESVLSGGGAYFIFSGARFIKRETAGLKKTELCSVIITAVILISSLYPVAFRGISAGRILAVAFILLTARAGGVTGGAAAGTAVAVSVALTGGDTAAVTLFCLAGLVAGLTGGGRVYETLAFFLCAAVSTVCGFSVNTAAVFIEICIGSAVFLLLPKSFIIKSGKIFALSTSYVKPTGLKKGITMRLTSAGSALKEVSNTVENVAKKLSNINAPDFENVLLGTENDACIGCSMQIYCWETRRDDTVSAVINMTKAVKNGDPSPENFAGEEFRGRCVRITRMGSAVKKRFSEYARGVAAENRIGEVRSTVCEQFSGISDMLFELSREFDKNEVFDTVLAEKTAAALKQNDVIVSECGVKLDRYGRATVEARIKNARDTVLNRAVIMRVMSAACDRDFDAPGFRTCGGDVYMTVCEKPKLSADVGSFSISAAENSVSGDAYSCYLDGKGSLIAILCDGMGTGGRAAVDATMASELMTTLLKAGFGYDCALKLLNSSMLFKSSDESLTTVDVTSVDLFSGKTELFKAGAAPTLVRRNGKTGKAQSTSLPAGILHGVSFDKAVISVKPRDIIVMMSDGAVCEGTEWISSEIESWQDGSASKLAERIAVGAKRRRSDSHSDDITVLVLIIDNAVQ